MKLEEFASVVLDSDILTKEEIASIIKHLSSVSSSPVGFLERKRGSLQCDGDIQQCCRLRLLSPCNWNYDGKTDAICFSVDKDIVLHGVCLFGRENRSHFVQLDVTESFSESSVTSKAGQFSSELMKRNTDYSHHGYRVSFDKKIILKKNTAYHIRAKISGSLSLWGLSGVSLVQCSGVTFKFMDSLYSNNATSVVKGQFPELLFSV